MAPLRGGFLRVSSALSIFFSSSCRWAPAFLPPPSFQSVVVFSSFLGGSLPHSLSLPFFLRRALVGALVAVGRGPVSRCGAVVSASVILLRVLGERPSPARRLLGHLSPLSGIGVTTASLFLREASRILRSGSRPPVGALASSFPPFIHPRRPLRGSPHSLWGLLPGCARLPRSSLAAVSF